MHAIIRSLLKEEKLSIVDVGATGGPEIHWQPWKDLCFFYTFDPDPKAKPWDSGNRNYPLGLWSHRCSETLHLAAYPPASSLFTPNLETLSSFPTYSALQQRGVKRIELHTLDSALSGEKVDFVKIDAEGAELEILKGGTKTIAQQCLGLQVEAYFCPIRQNAPLFSDLDLFIRGFDFQLFHIQREHWIRNQGPASPFSKPQLIFGNVLYLLPKKVFLKRLKACEKPQELFAKFLLILLAYDLYDYAYELACEVPFEEASTLKKELEKLSFSKKQFIKLITSLLMGVGRYALSFNPHSKNNRLCYLRRKFRELGALSYFFAKNNFSLFD